MAFSFKKAVAGLLLLGLLVTVPLAVWVAQQETRTAPKAYFAKPDPEVFKQVVGQAPAGEPQINLVWPFLGKVNDAVLIHGNDFGENPPQKQLMLGERLVSADYIKLWTSELIEFLIPPGSQSGPVNLRVSGRSATWELPFTIYDAQTPVQVMEKDGIVSVLGTDQPVKVVLYMDTGERVENDQPQAGVSYPIEQKIVSVQVLDASGNPMPFWVEPEEFDF